MDERLAELKKLVAVVEASSAAPAPVPTKEDFLTAAELVTTCGRILTTAANNNGDASAFSRSWKKIIGHILIAIGEWLIS